MEVFVDWSVCNSFSSVDTRSICWDIISTRPHPIDCYFFAVQCGVVVVRYWQSILSIFLHF